MKLKFKKKIGYLLILVVIIFIFGIFLYFRIENKKEYTMKLNFESRIEKLAEFDSKDYYKIGWLQVQGTNIDVPILDSTSIEGNLEYSFGWRSSAFQTGENREVLLGHNVLNVSSTPMLSNENLRDFESLMSFSYYDFAKENLYIQYTKNGKDELYLIYAIGFYDYAEDDSESISDKEELKKYIQNARNNSIYRYDIDVNEKDTLLALTTCTRYFGLNEKQQFIIDARKVREEEKTLKYSVKTTPVFDELITSSYEIN